MATTIIDTLVTNLTTKITGNENIDKYSRSLTKVADRATIVARKVNGMSSNVDGSTKSMKRTERQAGKLSKALTKLSRTATKASNKMASLGGKLVNRTTFGLAVAGISAIGAAAIKSSADIESLQTRLNAMGQGDKWGALADFAKSTPFQIDEITEAFISLKNRGLDPFADGLLQNVGDTASKFGRSIKDVAAALNSGMSGESEPLKGLGINSRTKDGRVTYTTFNDKGEKVTESAGQFDTIAKAIAINKIFALSQGQMALASQTLNGRVSTLKDNYVNLAKAVYDLTGTGDGLKNMVANLTIAINSIDKEALAENINMVKQIFSNIFELVSKLEPVVDALMYAFEQLGYALAGGAEYFVIATNAMQAFFDFIARIPDNLASGFDIMGNMITNAFTTMVHGIFGMMSKIPVIGKLFKGMGDMPKSTINTPLLGALASRPNGVQSIKPDIGNNVNGSTYNIVNNNTLKSAADIKTVTADSMEQPRPQTGG